MIVALVYMWVISGGAEASEAHQTRPDAAHDGTLFTFITGPSLYGTENI
jgi:hypothetical protein